MTFTTAAVLLAWVAITLLALGFAGLLRQLGDLHRASATGGATRTSPGASLIGLALPASGDLAALRPRGGGVLLFVSPGCDSCESVLVAVAAADPSLVLVSSGPCPLGAPTGSTCVPDALPLMERLSVPGTPYLLAVDPDGVIVATLLPHGVDQVRAFLDREAAARPGRH